MVKKPTLYVRSGIDAYRSLAGVAQKFGKWTRAREHMNNGMSFSMSSQMSTFPSHRQSKLKLSAISVKFKHGSVNKTRQSRQTAVRSEVDSEEADLVVDYDLDIGQPESFQQLGVRPSLCKVLERDNISVPTTVQYQALPVTLSQKQHCIIRSETGTGKTLTFLLPAFQEQLPGLTTLILVPTRELAVQMYHQASKLVADGRDKRAKRVMVVYAGAEDEEETQKQLSDVRPHILIGTPKRIFQLINTELKDIKFTSLRRLVLDEVDKLLLLPNKRSAKKLAVRELHPRPAKLIVERLLGLRRRYKLQLIATSATVDHQMKEELSIMGWGPEPAVVTTEDRDNRLVSPNSIDHCFLPCYGSEEQQHPEGYDKLDMLVNHFRAGNEKCALIFIHRNAPISQFVYDLRKRGIVAEALHENCLNPSQYRLFLEDFKAGKIEMVVGTEETVRGLDFVWLKTVYLMVVPRTAAEYLHLCGRVGRVGRHGRAIVILEDEKEHKRMNSHYVKLHVHGKAI